MAENHFTGRFNGSCGKGDCRNGKEGQDSWKEKMIVAYHEAGYTPASADVFVFF